jgi:hypothetical protein
MTLKEIIQNLKNTQNKSDAPTEYEIVLTDAFRFLGFQAKTIGGKGDTVPSISVTALSNYFFFDLSISLTKSLSFS